MTDFLDERSKSGVDDLAAQTIHLEGRIDLISVGVDQQQPGPGKDFVLLLAHVRSHRIDMSVRGLDKTVGLNECPKDTGRTARSDNALAK